MGILTFLDLDDTIFQTRRKCPDDVPLLPATVGRDGAPLSFMAPSQRALVAWLLRTTVVIPTTGRNLEALERVQLPFEHGAILSHGATIVDARSQPDESWQAKVSGIVEASRKALHRSRDALVALSRERRLDLRVRIVGDFDRDLYVVVKHPRADDAALDAARLACEALAREEPSLRLVPTDNNLSLVPRGISKQTAVRHVLAQRIGSGDEATIGVGDSLSDLAFMLDCHYALVPARSQIGEGLRRDA